MGLLDRSIIACLPLLPLPIMRSLSSRYIAGETLAEAIARLRPLIAQGYGGILDILGEDATDEAAARAVVDAYTGAADAIVAEGFDAYVSVKPTHLGLRLSDELCLELFAKLARRCEERSLFLRVEMEDHSTTDATLRIFERLRKEHDKVGIVLQSRLLRTPADIQALASGPLSVRMVKGVYLESAEIAHVERASISDAFVECSRLLFERGATVSFATHDELLGARLLELCRATDAPEGSYEFQVLLGVQERLWRTWRQGGEPVRVYIPFGPEWRAYSTRRLRKNPQILRHVMRDFFSFRR